MFRFLAAVLASASFAEGAMLGGYVTASCTQHSIGMGLPANTLNHALRFMHSLFSQKDLKLLYYSTQLVAGTNYRAIFQSPNADSNNIEYMGVEVYLKLPHYETAPRLSELIVSRNKEKVLKHFNIKESELSDNPSCQERILETIRNFNLQKELQGMEDNMAEVNNRPKKQTKGIDHYASDVCSMPMMARPDTSPLPFVGDKKKSATPSNTKRNSGTILDKIMSYFWTDDSLFLVDVDPSDDRKAKNEDAEKDSGSSSEGSSKTYSWSSASESIADAPHARLLTLPLQEFGQDSG